MTPAHEFYVTVLGLGALGFLIICVGAAIMWVVEHPHPRYPVTDDLDCEEYRAAADPDAVYDQEAGL